MGKDSVDLDNVDGSRKQQLIKKDSSDLDHEAALMVKVFEIIQSVTEQKEKKTDNASMSPPLDISDTEFKSDDIQQMEQNLTNNKMKEKDDKAEFIHDACWIKPLENKLNAMYDQSCTSLIRFHYI